MLTKYNLEIEGLRAVALIAVLLFHFFPSILPDGYLGVDVFFVISGYLITIKLKDKKKLKNFNLIKFYEKRLKRLIPALSVCLFFTSLIVFFLFLRSDVALYLKSLILSHFFLSNFFFLSDGGYFGGDSNLKPLLHTWSLSLEMQFYFFYPIFFIIFIFIFKKNININILLIILSILSFFSWFTLNKLNFVDLAFFSFVSRFWQFGLGGLLAINSKFFHQKFFKENNKFIFILSLLLIFTSFNYSLFFQSNSVYLKNLMASLGSVFFLFSTFFDLKVKKFFFSNVVLTNLGKSSYSIYLFHWPFKVFLTYYFINEASIPIQFSIFFLVLSLFSGYICYKLVENPFRKIYNFKFTFYLFTAVFITNILLGISVINNKNITTADMLSLSNKNNFKCKVYNIFLYTGSVRGCYLNKSEEEETSVALIGDSRASMYGKLFTRILQDENKTGVLLFSYGCLPLVDLNISKKCIQNAKKIFQYIENNENIKKIFFSMTWSHKKYIDTNGKSFALDDLLNSLFYLDNKLSAKNKEIFIISPILSPEKNITRIYPRLLKFKKISFEDLEKKLYANKEKYDRKYNYINKKISEHFGNRFIKAYEDLCVNSKCFFGNKSEIYFSDNQHLSNNSINIFKKTLKSIRNKIVE